MTRKFSFAAATLAAGLLFASASGMATTCGDRSVLLRASARRNPMSRRHMAGIGPARRGLNGYHKHVPGVGRVQCTAHKCWTNSWGIRRCRWF